MNTDVTIRVRCGARIGKTLRAGLITRGKYLGFRRKMCRVRGFYRKLLSLQ
jgi:hypothetical protein